MSSSDYYEIRLQLDNEKISYFFEIQGGAITCYYDFRGRGEAAG